MVAADIFRAYDIRGIVGDSLTEDSVYTIGLAIGSEAQQHGQTTVITARDGRLSGPSLVDALQQGLMASGCDVIDIGMVATPVLYFATHMLDTQTGVMLTGSHNPSDYNGLKIVIAGQTLSGDRIQALYQRILDKNLQQGAGKLSHVNVLDNYIERIVSDIELAKSLKVVIDCGNGVPGAVAPQLFKAIGADVTELFCDVDGNFPNHHPDPSIPSNLQDLINKVAELNADIGLAFDGDGDRLGVVTNKGHIIFPDRQLILFAKDVLARNPGCEIIYDVKCTRHVPQVVQQVGGVATMCRTGHSFVKQALRDSEQALLAGEMSGHIFFKERWFGFDDGLYAGVRLLEILSKTELDADSLFATIPNSINTPELKLEVPEVDKFRLMDELIAHADFSAAEISTIDGLRVDFAEGWGLVRPSNTTPVWVIRFEAETEQAMQKIQEQFRRLLLELDSSFKLPF